MKKKTPQEISNFFGVKVVVDRYGAVHLNDGCDYYLYRFFTRELVDYTEQDFGKVFFPESDT